MQLWDISSALSCLWGAWVSALTHLRFLWSCFGLDKWCPPPLTSQVSIRSLRADGPGAPFLVHAHDRQTLVRVLKHIKTQRVLIDPTSEYDPIRINNNHALTAETGLL